MLILVYLKLKKMLRITDPGLKGQRGGSCVLRKIAKIRIGRLRGIEGRGGRRVK